MLIHTKLPIYCPLQPPQNIHLLNPIITRDFPTVLQYKNISAHTLMNAVIFVTGSEKNDHYVIEQFVQHGPKALPRSRSRDFAISTPRYTTVSQLALTQVLALC